MKEFETDELGNKLKACPFCGGDATCEKESDLDGNDIYHIVCWGCGASSIEYYDNLSAKDKAELITAWNTRTTMAELAATREMVDRLIKTGDALVKQFDSELETEQSAAWQEIAFEWWQLS